MEKPVPDLKDVKMSLEWNFGDAPQIVDATLAGMAVISCLHFSDLPHCIGLNLVGPPSGGKTTALDILEGLPFVYATDKFTAKAFVSHHAARTKEQLAQIDLLPRIVGKTIIVPELAPTLGARYEDLIDNISILTRVFDGRGLTTDSGTQGVRGYSGNYKFCWLAATTPLPNHTWQVLGKLGTRWLFMPVEGTENTSDSDLVDTVIDSDYLRKITRCRAVIHPFLQWHWSVLGGFGGFHDPVGADEDKELMRRIAAAAIDCAKWRGLIQRQDDQGYNPNVTEVPTRLMATLYYLARGYALLDSRFLINEEDVTAVEHIGASSMPEDRRILRRELKARGRFCASDITALFGLDQEMSKPTALKLMDELVSLDVVAREQSGQTFYVRLK